jgi:hypothetical protein
VWINKPQSKDDQSSVELVLEEVAAKTDAQGSFRSDDLILGMDPTTPKSGASQMIEIVQ